jgi:DeoR family transcriptional regulator, carbon catabolite repression regulator
MKLTILQLPEGIFMYQEERLALIMEHLRHHRRISIDEICEKFNVSRDTARRDLVKLNQQGEIVRTRGGAILPTLSKHIFPYEQRLKTEPESKRKIGQLAASLINDGDYLILDASTTVQFAAEYIHTKNNVVVTNSIDIAAILAKKPHIRVHLLGGVLHSEQHYIYGSRAIETLKEYYVDKLFLGACGVSSDGITTPYEEEAFLIREMIQRADQVIVLIDHSKFNKRLFHKVCGLEAIDFIITDKEPNEEIKQMLKEHDIEILITERGLQND